MKGACEAHRCSCLMFIIEVRKIYVCVLTVLITLNYYNIRQSVPVIYNVKSSNPDSLIKIIIIINNDDNYVDFKEAIIIMLS